MNYITAVHEPESDLYPPHYIRLKLSNIVETTFTTPDLDVLPSFDFRVNVENLNKSNREKLSKYVTLDTKTPIFDYLKPLYPELFI
jgi:hypothetical protein